MAGAVSKAVTIYPRTDAQVRASDPGSHVWVTASAGTGKTQVLTDRMLRLMLAGSAPEKILALTFTRAAANEMQNRLTERLALWLRLDDATLLRELEALGVHGTPAILHRARCLFALALDVPGGVKVQTLHGFAQGLLAAFPVEANLPPGFRALDERDTVRLKGRALNEMIVEAQERGDHALLDDLAELAVASGENRVMQALGTMQGHAAALQTFGSTAAVEPAVRRWLKLADGDTAEASLLEAVTPGLHDDGRLQAFAAIMAGWGTKTGEEADRDARTWLAMDAADRAANFAMLRKLVATESGSPRKPALANKNPELRALIDDICADVLAVEAHQAKFAIAETASRHLRVGLAYTARYGALKRAQVAIDYDDMIRDAAALLGARGIPGWVAWKLDSRIDHILVDEAQDTNRAQWDIIAKLREEFFDGEQERLRSLFVVGDMKQAIYGFQGTEPQVFADERVEVERLALQAGRPLDAVPLDLSFRSGPAVLEVVSAFIAHAGHENLGLREAVGVHLPNRATAASQVTLWPVQVAGQAEDASEGEAQAESETGASPDEDDDGQVAADAIMAKTLAGQILDWLTVGHQDRLWLPAKARYAQPQDILVLFRKRSRLMAGLVSALHDVRVPVAGVDRLLLTEPYAVLDCLALMRFAVQPEDDLNLACLLASPFLGWNHEAVRQISGTRKGSLWAALGASHDAASQHARVWLGKVLGMADLETPYRFLDGILSGPLEGRRKLLARLGTEAVQAIDELLNQALAYEQDHAPALEGFLAWIAADGVVVKRDSDGMAGDVRLMTIHGAKGLEAPVVVLADAAHMPKTGGDGHVMVRMAGHAMDVPLFHGGAKRLSGEAKALHEADAKADAEEDLRLLYVALTRAADHLFLGGAVAVDRTKVPKKNPELSKNLGLPGDPRWHTRIGRVFDGMEAAEEAPAGRWAEHAFAQTATRRVVRGVWTVPGPDVPDISPDSAKSATTEALETGPAPEPARPPRPLTPSALGRDDVASPPPTEAMRAAAARGRLLHSLFERLPPVSPARRPAVALAWLKAQGAKNPDEIAAAALAVIEAPEFADLFGEDALAETPIAGVDGEMVIAGTVDRLIVTPARVLVVDFKTGLRVPAALDSVPIPYVRQMAAYRAVLEKAFPGRTVETGLLYTAAPKLILLPAKLLDANWPPIAA